MFGVVVYLVAAWRGLTRSGAITAVKWLVGGACAFGVPYHAFFVIPG